MGFKSSYLCDRPLENQNYESPDGAIFEVEDNVTDSDEYSPSTINGDSTTLPPSPTNTTLQSTPQTYQRYNDSEFEIEPDQQAIMDDLWRH
jgi:hypothetical protein